MADAAGTAATNIVAGTDTAAATAADTMAATAVDTTAELLLVHSAVPTVGTAAATQAADSTVAVAADSTVAVAAVSMVEAAVTAAAVAVTDKQQPKSEFESPGASAPGLLFFKYSSVARVLRLPGFYFARETSRSAMVCAAWG
jgi:hypothetical protein